MNRKIGNCKNRKQQQKIHDNNNNDSDKNDKDNNSNKSYSMPRSPRNCKLKRLYTYAVFSQIFPQTLKFIFFEDYFHKLWIFCIYIGIKVFFVLDMALLNATGNNIPKLDHHHHHHRCFHGIILRVMALNTAQKIKFSIKDFLSKCDQTVDFGTFTEGILNGKLHFLYSGTSFDVVLWNLCKSIIALTVVLFSTRILAF